MRTALICHHDNPINRELMPRFLASFSDLAGIVVITEGPGRLSRRLQFEWRRSRLHMLDVFAFQIAYRLRQAAEDRAWVRSTVDDLSRRYRPAGDVPVHHTGDPNDDGTRRFLASLDVDLVLARCKTLLRPEVFRLPRLGTYVVHPGICPEYRNAHGCFWALARRDVDNVGATLLRIDEGVDTGPVFGYYRTDTDEQRESHVVIQHRVVLDNLDALRADLQRIGAGTAVPLDVSGRASAAWGQPRLTDYLRWKRAARAV